RDFIRFLEGNRAIFTQAEQRRDYCGHVESYFGSIVDDINEAVKARLAAASKISTSEIEKLTASTVSKHHQQWKGLSRLKLPAGFESRIRRQFNADILKIRKQVFKKLPLS